MDDNLLIAAEKYGDLSFPFCGEQYRATRDNFSSLKDSIDPEMVMLVETIGLSGVIILVAIKRLCEINLEKNNSEYPQISLRDFTYFLGSWIEMNEVENELKALNKKGYIGLSIQKNKNDSVLLLRYCNDRVDELFRQVCCEEL